MVRVVIVTMVRTVTVMLVMMILMVMPWCNSDDAKVLVMVVMVME